MGEDTRPIYLKIKVYIYYALNSTIHGIEILYQTAPNHGELEQDNASICLRVC